MASDIMPVPKRTDPAFRIPIIMVSLLEPATSIRETRTPIAPRRIDAEARNEGDVNSIAPFARRTIRITIGIMIAKILKNGAIIYSLL
jgi:hypothetical protein